MATRFGEFTKQLRVENHEFMMDMAEKLNVSKSFLSQVENGIRKPPKDWKDKIQDKYTLNKMQLKELRESMFVTLNKECIDISSYEEYIRDVIFKMIIKIEDDKSIVEQLDDLLNAS